jgi:hypothetical protein
VLPFVLSMALLSSVTNVVIKRKLMIMFDLTVELAQPKLEVGLLGTVWSVHSL